MRTSNVQPATPATSAPFNPHGALQSLLSADVMSIKQRVRAAQQLEEYFRHLTPTPSLLTLYEPYLPLLLDVLITPIDDCQELQSNTLAMLQTLSAHNPIEFSDWIAKNTQLGYEPWLVQWSYALLLQAEKLVPRENGNTNARWEETSLEFKQFDRVFVRVMQMWRTLLDHTADEALVDHLVKYLQALLIQTDTNLWRTLMLKRLQAHFVDIADVLVGWMMSTGPHSPLREDIFALLNNFGRLWADNSVFSLQLMNSFADEIISLCDLWNHEGDSDRLSTLLTCFMMVAQCVPVLALSNDKGAKSPLTKVLTRVAACPQPEYSMFCVANCSDYLVSISNSRHSHFAPQSVAAIAFLLHHCAVQSCLHDCEVNKLSTVLKNACKLASANFSTISDPLLVRADAIGIFKDFIPSPFLQQNGQRARVTVLDCLFRLECANVFTYITQLCLQLGQVGGIGALKVLGECALQDLNDRNGNKENSYFVFAATCFILIFRDPERLKLGDDKNVVHIIAILDLIAAILKTQKSRQCQPKLTPRHLCLLLKMACAIIKAVSQYLYPPSNGVNTVQEISLLMLELAISMLPSETVVFRDHRLTNDTLQVISELISKTTLIPLIPQNMSRCLLKRAASVLCSTSVRVRLKCIQLLEEYHSRADARNFAKEVFDLILNLLLDPSSLVQCRIMSGAFSRVVRYALMKQKNMSKRRPRSPSVHPSFVSADFKSIFSRFQSRECGECEWNLICRSIMTRITPGVSLGNADLLLGPIRQAAAWCVQNRLRTFLGGPANSFASIERMLQEYSDEAQDRARLAFQIIGADDLNSSSSTTGSLSHQMLNWLMLEFVSELEMQITLATCDTDMDQSKSESDEYKTALFFRKNKVICDDWLYRIRPFLVEMSKRAACYELKRYHSHALMMSCYSKLSRAMTSYASCETSETMTNELTRAEKDLDAALFSLCQCHCDAKDADSITGFQRWSVSISSALNALYQLHKEHMDIPENYCEMSLFGWLNAVRYEAEMQYENAAKEYEVLLDRILTREKPDGTGPARIFEDPMKFLRMSPLALLGCIKQCAKCYAALREWTKLHKLVSHFMDQAKSFENNNYPIEEVQAIFNCRDAWSNVIGIIRSLELPIDQTVIKNEWKSDCANRAAQALRVWDAIGETNMGLTGAALLTDSSAIQHRQELIPLALQPFPWNGYVGDKVGKKAEEIILRMFGVSASINQHQLKSFVEVNSLNSEVFDSITWGQSYCTPRSGGSGWSADAECLYLTGVARLARKQHNFSFAQTLLQEAGNLIDKSPVSAMALSYEKAKLLKNFGMEEEGHRLLESQCKMGLGLIGRGDKFSELEIVTTRFVLHLAKLSARVGNVTHFSSAASLLIESTLGTASANMDNTSLNATNFNLNSRDEFAFKCFHTALALSPQSAKAWAHYSHWCYDHGKREIERISGQNGFLIVNSEDELELKSLVGAVGFSERDRDRVLRAFYHVLDKGELMIRRIDDFRQLCTEIGSSECHRDALDRLTWLHQKCHSKMLRYHALAARGYGKYLTVCYGDSSSCISRQEVTMIVLRVFGILVTCGAEENVVSVLEDVISNGPVTPWSYIIPQVIARAHHSIPTVASLVCLILKRLALQLPHAIVYPAVADAMDLQASCHKEGSSASATFDAVLQELQVTSSGQVEGVRLLVSELRRISILWDEAWISTLVKLSADVSRRMITLEKEANRVEKNPSLSTKEKSELAHRKMVAIMKPIYVLIEKLWKETCGNVRDQHAVTPNERNFLKEYGRLIDKAMTNFRDCCSAELRPEPIKNARDLWQPFADILTLLNATGNREQLPLVEISPAMASTSRLLALTNIPGGTTSDEVEPITISRVNSSVTVLRTKTKPKSLEVIGSDGKVYRYLLKAREDLRLDERIMQYLRVTNDFLKADDAAEARDLSAQSYSVIPLSKNAGLIQMVPNVVPLFQVYTARNDASGRAHQDFVAGSSAQQQPSPPTAQFYTQLKQHGILNVSPTNRQQWPTSVLKKVYQELVAQRPRNVLQQEILCHSEDLRQSWTKCIRLIKSLAVMSVLGYIIGLGDRHLDNILLCIKSGDIVHIDHNICFDKGRRLKVSEIVPFRLTLMLQDALGVTGVEGIFRTAFEATLRIVRSTPVREALLTLFEAFVYSPLVDWSVEDKRQGRSGDLKAQLEANMNLSMFLSRAEERRQDTIAFGRQYEQCADNICRTLTESAVPFVTMLEQRKLLLSIEREEHAISKEYSTVKAELSALQSAEDSKRAEVKSLTAQFTKIAGDIQSFADDCFARHRQIQVWKQKCVAFAESQPLAQLGAVTTAIDTASFQVVHAKLSNASKSPQFTDSLSQLLAALESKCPAVDADVTRLRYQIRNVAVYLIPYLSYYGHQRNELDAYIASELELGGKDVYFKWWKLCTEYLRDPAEKETQEYASAIVTCATPSKEDIAESKMVLSRLNKLHSGLVVDSKVEFNEAYKAVCISRANHLLQEVSNALFAMKLSNAQCQRLMKLAGASWMLETFEQLKGETCTPNAGAFTPSLKAPPKFKAMVAVTHACFALFDLVSTHKGSMKKFRASDIFAFFRDRDFKGESEKCLVKFNDVMEKVRSFAVVLEEEFVSNIYGRDFNESRELLDLVEKLLTAPTGKDKLMAIVSMSKPEKSTDVSSSIQTMLIRQPGVCKLLAAGFAVIHEMSSLVGMLHSMSILTNEELEHIKDLPSTLWLDFMLNVIELFTVTIDDNANLKVETLRAIWLVHIDKFVSECLVLVLRNQLLNIITHEWKFDFYALDQQADKNDAAELESLSKRWAEFSCSQIIELLPSTLANSSTATLETQASNVTKSIAAVMMVCEEWWTNQWGEARLKAWTQRVSSIRTRHVGRLRYATWLAAVTPAEDENTSLTRSQLVACVSSQMPQLNALMTDQVALEASVSEMAQQMDYLASNVSDVSHLTNESLHACIQSCKSKVAGLFEYGRTLGDLVQGISVIETSSGEIQLEVDGAGTNILQSASSVMLELQSLNEALDVVVTRVQEFQGKLQQIQNMCNAIVKRKRTVENELQSLCLNFKFTVLEVAHVLSKNVNEMQLLLQDFTKLRRPSKQAISDPVSTASVRNQQVQTDARDPLAVEPPTGLFLFMENERLVRVLLRSIQSVNHLQGLERVLIKHGDQSTLLCDTIDQLDHLLSDFDTRAKQIFFGNDKRDESSKVYMLLQLLLDLTETLQVVKSEPTAGTSDLTSASPLIAARDLVRGCVKLFFEATEMANRLSSIRDDETRKGASVSDAEVETLDDSVVVQSGTSVVMDVRSGSCSHDVAAGLSRSVEEKSQYGLQVLKRIEAKLSGSVPEVADAPAVLTVEQQALWLIAEATKTDNLCLMYEGWTPWI